jgi:hypothetical protein
MFRALSRTRLQLMSCSNWFINIASPIVNIPLSKFAFGTFFGVMPQTAIAVHAGVTLESLSSPTDIFELKTIATMAALAVASILPTLTPVRNFVDRVLNKRKSD